MASKRQKATAKAEGMLGWLVICGLGAILSGCGPIIGQFTGRRSETVEVKAKYELHADNLLILVDSPADVASSSRLRVALSSGLEREIKLYGLAESVVPASRLSALRSSREEFGKVAIEQIGRELRAQQVLYVEIIDFQLDTLLDKSAGQGLMRGRIKIFDVVQNRRVWPKTEPSGHEVTVRMGLGEARGTDYQRDFTEELCKRMVMKVVNLFRDHKEPRGLRQ